MESIDARLRARCVYVLTFAAGIVASLALSAWNPAGNAFFPKCIFYAATGLQCPGCGTQRALHHVLNLRIVEGMRYNPLTVLALPLLAVGFWRWTRTVWFHVEPAARTPRARWIWALASVVLAFWLIRNTPLFPSI